MPDDLYLRNRPPVTIRIEGDFDLDLDQLFPDGTPEGWTIEDVVAAIKAAGNAQQLIRDWDLTPSVSVDTCRPTSPGVWDLDTARVWS